MTDGELKFPHWPDPRIWPRKPAGKNPRGRSAALRAPPATRPIATRELPCKRPADRTHHEARPPRLSPIRI